MVARTPRRQCCDPHGRQFPRRSRDFTFTHLVIFPPKGLPSALCPPPATFPIHVLSILRMSAFFPAVLFPKASVHSNDLLFWLETAKLTVCKTADSKPQVNLTQENECGFFFSTFYFVLGYRRWTMLWYFQMNSGGTQPYIYMYPFSPRPFSHLGCHINILIHTWTFIYLNSNVSKELGLSQLGNFRRRKNKFHLASGITRKKTLKPDL